MAGWEYASMVNKGPAGRDQLNELGRQGWELVSVVPRHVYVGQGWVSTPGDAASWADAELLYVFKRPLAQATPAT